MDENSVIKEDEITIRPALGRKWGIYVNGNLERLVDTLSEGISYKQNALIWVETRTFDSKDFNQTMKNNLTVSAAIVNKASKNERE